MNKDNIITNKVIRSLSMQIMALETSYEILGEILKESTSDLTTDFGRGYLEGQMKVQLEQIWELESLKSLILNGNLMCELPEEQGYAEEEPEGEGLNE